MTKGWKLCVAVGLFALTSSIASAGPTKIEISVNLKKDPAGKAEKGHVTKEVTQAQYSVKLTNRSFADVDALKAEYRIFVRDDSGKGTVSQQKLKKQSFQTDIPAIANNSVYTFVTEPVKLEFSQLDPDRYYLNGARNKSADKVAGVWIRILQGDKIVGEYLNPSTIATKEKF